MTKERIDESQDLNQSPIRKFVNNFAHGIGSVLTAGDSEGDGQVFPSSPLTRREFLKLSGTAAGMMAIPDFLKAPLDPQKEKILNILTNLNPYSLKIVKERDIEGKPSGRVTISLTTGAVENFPQLNVRNSNYAKIDFEHLIPDDAVNLEYILRSNDSQEGDSFSPFSIGAGLGLAAATALSARLNISKEQAQILLLGGAAMGGAVGILSMGVGTAVLRVKDPERFNMLSAQLTEKLKVFNAGGSRPPIPTAVPTPRPNGSPTPTPEIRVNGADNPYLFVPGSWASYKDGNKEGKETGLFNPEEMYPIVGAVDFKHRQYLDVGTFADMQVAINTKKDLTQIKDKSQLQQMRDGVSEVLDTNEILKKQMQDVKDMVGKEYSSLSAKPKKITVVLNTEQKIEQIVVIDNNDEIRRFYFKPLADVNVIEFKELKDYNLLPQLQVSGAYILREDKLLPLVENDKRSEEERRRIQFKGVDIANFSFLPERERNFLATKSYIDIASKWGTNFLRLDIDFDLTFPINDRTIEELLKVIEYAEKKGMYCSLNPINKVNPSDLEGKFSRAKGMSKLAEKLKRKNNVMYHLINEVQEAKKWDEVSPKLGELASNIRAASPEAILLVPGLNWNTDFSRFVDDINAMPFSNVMYDVHYYAHIFNGSDISDSVMKFSGLLGKRPVIFTEAGVIGAQKGQKNSLDEVYRKKMLELMNKYPNAVHYSGFVMARSGGLDGDEIALLTRTSSLSPRGEFYSKDMADPSSVQQTFFTK